MKRILDSLFFSKYSIHDLSRCQGGGAQNLARFNMPLELGMAIAQSQHEIHDWIVLTPQKHHHKDFVSDLAGYDFLRHQETMDTVVPLVLQWLLTRRDVAEKAVRLNPATVLPELDQFRGELAISESVNGSFWKFLVDTASRVASAMPE